VVVSGVLFGLLAVSIGLSRVASAGSVVLRSAPIDAALVTPDAGWILTADELLLSRDGGATFARLRPDLPAGPVRAAFFRDDRQGWVAAAGPDGIAVARTVDGGRTWARSTVAVPKAPPVALRVAFGDTRHGALLARAATSAAFSRADLYTTADGGASWTRRTAPAAGEITVAPDGRIQLVGGVRQDKVFVSTDDGRGWSPAAGAAARPATGWVLDSTGACAAGKRDCAITDTVKDTRDGREIARWQRRVD